MRLYSEVTGKTGSFDDWVQSPSSLTFTPQATAKKTARLLSSSSEWPRPVWSPTSSLNNPKMTVRRLGLVQLRKMLRNGRYDQSSEASCTFSSQLFSAVRIVALRASEATSTMGLPEELYHAMLGVGYQAKRHKIPGPLAGTMIDVAQKSLDLWRRDERAAFRFASLVMTRPSMLRNTVAKLPWPVAEACWRLINLLEYRAGLDGEETC